MVAATEEKTSAEMASPGMMIERFHACGEPDTHSCDPDSNDSGGWYGGTRRVLSLDVEISICPHSR